MHTTLITAITGVGGLLTAVTTVGMSLSLLAGQAPGSVLIGLITVGLVLVVAGTVSRFQTQTRLHSSRMEDQLRARWSARQGPGTTSLQPAVIQG